MRAYLTLDMLSALAILAILVSISVPSLSNILRDLRLKKEVERISYAFESTAAKSSRESAHLVLTLEKNGLSVRTEENPSELLNSRTLPKNYLLDFLPLNKHIHFYKQGTCSPASFQISYGERRCTFNLSLRCRSSVSCKK